MKTKLIAAAAAVSSSAIAHVNAAYWNGTGSGIGTGHNRHKKPKQKAAAREDAQNDAQTQPRPFKSDVPPTSEVSQQPRQDSGVVVSWAEISEYLALPPEIRARPTPKSIGPAKKIGNVRRTGPCRNTAPLGKTAIESIDNHAGLTKGPASAESSITVHDPARDNGHPGLLPRLLRGMLHYPLRDAIVVAIFFFIVFGSLYTIVEYLLSVTRASAATCVPSTVFVPVTQVVTTTETVLYSPPSADLTTVLVTTVAATTTITADASVSQAALPSTSSGPYVFSVVSSSTMWQDGVSPSSGAPLGIATSLVTLSPVESIAAESTTWMTLTSTSTRQTLTTITLPATTSTTFSMLTTALTTTLTSTHYVTYSLSAVSSHSSFAGISAGGWNASSTQPIATQSTPDLPAMTTLTETHYFGTGNMTTSTSTNRITTTLGAIITTTLQPPATVVTISAAGAPMSVTTVTAAPVTVTYTVQSAPLGLSTSVDFSSVEDSTLIGAAAATPTSAVDSSPSSTQPGLSSSVSSGTSRSTPTPSSSLTGSPLPTLSPTSSLSAMPQESGANSSPANISAAGLPSAYTIPTVYTITSFLSGSGTTLTVTSLPGLTTPMSAPSSNSSTALPTMGLNSGESSVAIETAHGPAEETSTVASDTAAPSESLLATSLSSEGVSESVALTSASDFPGTSYTVSASASSLSISSSIPLASSAATRSSIESQDTSSLISRSATRASSSPSSSSLPSSLTPSLPTSLSSTSFLSSITSGRTSGHIPSSAVLSRNNTAFASTTQTASSSFSNPFPASSATATPTRGCGDSGNVTLGFDDLPAFHPDRKRNLNSTQSGPNDITHQPPLDLRPYNHLTFSNGFVYAPKDVEPFTPVSQPNVAAFLANGTGMRTGQHSGDIGEIGDGPAPDDISAFWFDAFSTFLGCDNSGPDNCTMEVSGLKWDPDVKNEVPAFSQNYTLPPCPVLKDCTLTPVALPNTARNLTGLEIRAIVGGKPRMFFMDDMHMAWSNKTCAAGLLRQRTQ